MKTVSAHKERERESVCVCVCVLHPQLSHKFLAARDLCAHCNCTFSTPCAFDSQRARATSFFGSIKFASLPQSSFDCPSIKTGHMVQLGRKRCRYAHARLEMLWLIQIYVRVVPLAIRVTSAFVWGRWLQRTFRRVVSTKETGQLNPEYAELVSNVMM